jgi:phosphoenolpyruvate---glycerone phosphotransferase subunit DhaL
MEIINERFTNADGIVIVHQLIKAIQDNKQYLSDIDGAIGDGDHGINMSKGFTLCQAELEKKSGDLTYGMSVLSKNLMLRIGGSMGPLYGKFFQAVSKTTENKEFIDKYVFGEIIKNMVISIQSVSQAQVGDKTLMDTLVPAKDAFVLAIEQGRSFKDALSDLKKAAETGRDSTKDMVAKLGRSSRLGERSRGVLDAGSVSCCIILTSMVDSIEKLIQ